MKRSQIIFVPDELEGDEPLAFPTEFARTLGEIYNKPKQQERELQQSLSMAFIESRAQFHRLFGTVHTY